MSRDSSKTPTKYSASGDPVVAYRKSLKEQLKGLIEGRYVVTVSDETTDQKQLVTKATVVDIVKKLAQLEATDGSLAGVDVLGAQDIAQYYSKIKHESIVLDFNEPKRLSNLKGWLVAGAVVEMLGDPLEEPCDSCRARNTRRTFRTCKVLRAGIHGTKGACNCCLWSNHINQCSFVPLENRKIVNTSGSWNASKSRQGRLAGALTKLKQDCDKADSLAKLRLLNEALQAVVLTADEVFEEEASSGVPFVKQKGVKIQGALATFVAVGDHIKMLTGAENKRKRGVASTDENESDWEEVPASRRKVIRRSFS